MRLGGAVEVVACERSVIVQSFFHVTRFLFREQPQDIPVLRRLAVSKAEAQDRELMWEFQETWTRYGGGV